MRRVRRATPVALVLLTALGLSGCADVTERYCDAVADNQDRLSEIAGSEDELRLFEVRDVYRDLADVAPSDIRDEWELVIGRIDALESALDDAGVEPDGYDPQAPPAGLSTQEQARITQAADDLTAPDTISAMRDVEQQALDVCGTPLRL